MATTNDPMMPERDLATDPASRFDAGRGYQIVAMFETFERARAARDRLIEEGIPAADMELMNRDADAGAGYSSFDYERTDEGFWGGVKRLFGGGHEHSAAYAEGLRRGQAMLVVRPPAERHDRVVEILEGYDPIDFDAEEEEWRKSGWTGAPPVMATSAEAGSGALGRVPGAGRPVEASGLASGLPGATRTTETTATAAAREEAIPVVEESVRVGKRLVDRGGVRIRSYVVERPIEQDVTLREERVDVERRAVDRPAGTLPEDAFRERTIEVSASGEEAVVQKDARVIEEVVVSKDARERTETVRDTVRKTEVEVEDTRTGEKTRPTKI